MAQEQRTAAAQAIARVRTVSFIGLEVADIDVQVQISNGLPSFSIVGLPDKAVAESRERVRAALNAMGLALPPRRFTINLAPADLAKEGSHFDLPIALGLLVVMGVLPAQPLDGKLVLGELALDGSITSVNGVLPAAIAAVERGLSLVCPQACGAEAAWLASEVEILAAPHLLSLLNHLRGHQKLAQPAARQIDATVGGPDMREVKGQETAKRAIEIAAAGGHNILLCGPPGSGKSMLAQRLPGLLPPLDPAEILEVGMIRSVGGKLKDGKLTSRRPFRAPHHAASMAAMVGGGTTAKPGEVSLAHKGVLFLDELPEFQRNVLDALRQPLEAGEVTVARVNLHATYPARFQLVAAMNPCRCGHLDNPVLACTKAPRCAQDYQKRLSGPLLDRFDLHVDVPALHPDELDLPVPGEGTAEVAARVAAVRAHQADRFLAVERPRYRTNADAEGDVLDLIAPLHADARALLKRAAERLHLSARGWHRIIRVARTIADLDGAEIVNKPHVAEAVSYRRRLPGKV